MQDYTRELAKVVRMGKVEKHPNADRLKVGEIGGWKVIVGSNIEEGDVGVYFEIDSILPNEPWVKECSVKSTMIKTIKLRGVLSQGLFLKLKSLPLNSINSDENFWLEKGDVTTELKVTKNEDDGDNESNNIPYERVFKLGGPPKTSEPRIQSNKNLIELLLGKPYYISLKYDGTSVTYDLRGDEMIVCSRNYTVTKKDSVYWIIVEKYSLKEKLTGRNLILQGEIYGPGIDCMKKNQLEVSSLHFVVFNIWNKDTLKFLDFSDFVSTCNQLGLHHVEILEVGDSFNLSVDDLLEKAKGFYPNTKNHREGIVIRPQNEKITPSLHRLSFKCINNDYLL
jgi:RNA ligase (TIGR02306 family)